MVITKRFSTVVPVRSAGSALPLFFIHGVGGVLPKFELLLDKLCPEHPIFGIRSQAFDPEQSPLLTLEEMAARYLHDIRDVVSDGPFGLIGFSFGGMVGFEIAQQMCAEGCRPPALLMLDSMEMSRLKRQAQSSPPGRRTVDLIARLSRRVKEAVAVPDPFAYVLEKITSRWHRLFYSVGSRLGMPIGHSVHNPSHVNWFAAVNYTPKPYNAPFHLFKAKEHYWEPRTPHDLGWGPWAARGLEIVEIACDHVSLFQEPNVSALAVEMNRCLELYGCPAAS